MSVKIAKKPENSPAITTKNADHSLANAQISLDKTSTDLSRINAQISLDKADTDLSWKKHRSFSNKRRKKKQSHKKRVARKNKNKGNMINRSSLDISFLRVQPNLVQQHRPHQAQEASQPFDLTPQAKHQPRLLLLCWSLSGTTCTLCRTGYSAVQVETPTRLLSARATEH